jgi:hypothetical protein
MKIQRSTYRLLLLFLVCFLLTGMIPFHQSALASSATIDVNAIDGYMTAQMGAALLPGASRMPR